MLRLSRQTMDDLGNITINPHYKTGMLVDQNLAAALYSTISSSLLPYLLNQKPYAEIWQTIERILQSTNRSRILQLKNELHHITMEDKTI